MCVGRRDRGFSLLLVMVLVAVMFAVAGGMTMALRERQSSSSSARERRTGAALYAAQAAVARAKDALLDGDAVTEHACGEDPRRAATDYFVTNDGEPVRLSWCVRSGTVEAYGFVGAVTSHLSWSWPGSGPIPAKGR